MISRYSILFLLVTIPLILSGQSYSSHRVRVLVPVADTITIDTLSLMPGSVSLALPSGESIPPEQYSIGYGSAQIILSDYSQIPDSLVVKYRVLPIMLEGTHQFREYEHYLSPDSLLGRDAPRYIVPRSQPSPFGEGIRVSGSFTRGVSFGNNQDISVASGMNIRLEGELGDNLMIEGAISDQTVPLQPEGNTYQLQEFDRVYLRVYSDRASLQAGDIEMRSSPTSPILTFARSVQGILVETEVLGDGPVDSLSVVAGAAVARGKFARNTLVGADGNQGPYRLQGAEGEIYIIVIAGSERIFVDGVLMERGEDRHYTIDYNLGEVSFTPLMPINRYSRIVVEFEYSERSYARFNSYLSFEGRSGQWGWRTSAYSEQDSRNQPFEQDLNEDQRRLLASIGDDLDRAFTPQVDSVEFDPDLILYHQFDTLVGDRIYSIYRHSSNPALAHYRVSFSYVGIGNGNYVPDYGSSNGRVYRWVAPLEGEPQGSYAPVRKLITPKKHQMVSAGVDRYWGRGSGIHVDYALSNNDLNTFSHLDSHDDVGHAVRVAVEQRITGDRNSSGWSTGSTAMTTSDGFRYIDRFREQEFERNWALDPILQGGDEQQADIWIRYSVPHALSVTAIAEGLRVGDSYQGGRGRLVGWQSGDILRTQWDVSHLNTTGLMDQTTFQRAKGGITKPVGWLDIGILSEIESRRTTMQSSDSLHGNSFEWYMLKAFVEMHDTLPQRAGIAYSYREDFLPLQGSNAFIGSSHEVNLNGVADAGAAGSAQATVGYRLFSPSEVFGEINASKPKESTLLGRLEYSNHIARGAWMVSGGYELGSGLEPENEYFFVEVLPGQGLYTWIDYNGNGVKELDEFEIATFSDEARYIKVNVPGVRMVSVRSNSLSARSSINLARLIETKQGFLGFVRRLSNQTSFSTRNRNRIEGLAQAANPFPSGVYDSLIVSKATSIRNSLAFNRANRKFGMEYIHSQTMNRVLQANGTEQRHNNANTLATWVGLPLGFTVRAEGEIGVSTSTSEHFPHRDFQVERMIPKVSLRRSGSKGYTAELGYSWQEQSNKLGIEQSVQSTIYAQLDLMSASRGSVMLRTSVMDIAFEGEVQSAVAYEMLKGLEPGRNAVWEVALRRRLSQLFELELGYNGRYLANGRVVHTGSMMARALF